MSLMEPCLERAVLELVYLGVCEMLRTGDARTADALIGPHILEDALVGGEQPVDLGLAACD